MKKIFFRYLAIWFCLLGITLILGSFLKGSAQYAFYSWRLADTEQAAEEGVWTSNGREVWGEKISAQFEREKAEKTAFIESSDTAKFLHTCAYSLTGQVIRVLAIFVALVGFVDTLYLLVITSKSFISYLRKCCKYLYLKRARNRRQRTR